MDTIAILQQTLDYVDEHITDDITPERLAAQAGFSTWHFCRAFQCGVGYTVMAYVRQRRLAFAACELASGKRILDISLKYRFDTHSGFSKAFRRYFGCSPATYRLHARGGRLNPPSLPRTNNYLTGGIILEPKFVTLAAVKLAGYAIKTTSSDGENSKTIPAFWQTYMTDGRMDKLHAERFVKAHDGYGVCFPEDPQDGAFDYVIGVERKEGEAVPDGYQTCTIPPASYAVFSTPPSNAERFVSAIQGTWNYIFSEWFQTSGYEYAPDCVDFERYDDRCMSDVGKVCDIYIPIVKKHN